MIGLRTQQTQYSRPILVWYQFQTETHERAEKYRADLRVINKLHSRNSRLMTGLMTHEITVNILGL